MSDRKGKGTFEFITAIGKPKAHDDEDLRKIRDHLARRYRRKPTKEDTSKIPYRPALRPKGVSSSSSTSASSLSSYESAESRPVARLHECDLYRDSDGMCLRCAGNSSDDLDSDSSEPISGDDERAAENCNVVRLVRTAVDSKMSDPFDSACIPLSPEATFLANHCERHPISFGVGKFVITDCNLCI